MTVLDSTLPQPPLLLVSSPCDSTPHPRKRKLDLKITSVMEGNADNTDASNQSNGATLKRKEPIPAKKQKIGAKQAVRGRRKSRWKLKFHHQALPPEYLKHYKQQEKKRRFTETKKVLTDKVNAKKPTGNKGCEVGPDGEVLLRDNLTDDFDELPENRLDSGILHTDARRFENDARDEIWPACMPASAILGDSFPHLNIDISQNKAFIENLLSNQIEINRVDRNEKTQMPPMPPKPVKPRKPKAIPSSGRIMNYSDLPYMGEITLDGVKPRRGRKPKKADICHLIYKNYGQVFPGAPPSTQEGSSPKEGKWRPPGRPPSTLTHRAKETSHPQAESPLPTVTGLLNHSEVQNRIINSLLERRLTQKVRGKPDSIPKPNETTEEPLNLCLKDLQSLKIKLSRKHGNIYETKSPASPLKDEVQDHTEVKKEVIDLESEESSVEDSDLTPFNLVTAELRDSEDDECVSLGDLGSQVSLTKLSDADVTPDSSTLPPDPMAFWPRGNYFYPPMPLMPDLYYQKLNAMKQQPPEKKSIKMTKPKSTNKRQTSKPNPNAAQVIARRKRSAIFIPPVPAENTTNPTTEVSICKFKFTGGAKPSLQEKKMLSVDSGGNFRYYSGTGDKSMRGYEYFPRESLQQCQEYTGCSPSGVFLTASALGSGEKIPEDVGHSGFFDQSFPLQVTATKTEPNQRIGKRKPGVAFPALREHLADSLDADEDSDSDGSTAGLSPIGPDTPDSHDGEQDARRRARRSRKSLAREKLEQTFKEKGFLIQTQQLESAEGATYCKFRQLRKFTRYLFRSWKDYLPGNVRDLSDGAGVGSSIEDQPPPLSPPLMGLETTDI